VRLHDAGEGFGLLFGDARGLVAQLDEAAQLAHVGFVGRIQQALGLLGCARGVAAGDAEHAAREFLEHHHARDRFLQLGALGHVAIGRAAAVHQSAHGDDVLLPPGGVVFLDGLQIPARGAQAEAEAIADPVDQIALALLGREPDLHVAVGHGLLR